jgi:hypothetical protein
MASVRNETRPIRLLRYTARGLFIVWAAFWIFFNVASGAGELDSLGIMALISHLLMPLLALMTLYFVWRQELFGGILLVLQAVFFSLFFHTREWFMLLTLPCPLLLSGVLLLVCWAASRPHRVKPQPA